MSAPREPKKDSSSDDLYQHVFSGSRPAEQAKLLMLARAARAFAVIQGIAGAWLVVTAQLQLRAAATAVDPVERVALEANRGSMLIGAALIASALVVFKSPRHAGLALLGLVVFLLVLSFR